MKVAAYIFAAVVLIIAGGFLWQKFGPNPEPEKPPASGTVPVTQQPSVTHGSPSLPTPDEHTTGVVRITVPPDTVAGVVVGKPREIYIYLTDRPADPPMVRSDSPIQAAFSPVVDPWLKLQVALSIGISADGEPAVSPWGGVSLVQLFRRVDIGAGIDEDGIGVFATYNIWREFSVGAMWYALPVFDSDARAAIVVCYTF